MAVPEDSRASISAHGFWNWGNAAMFDIRIVNLDAGSYLRMIPKKDIANSDNNKNYLYLQACLESRRSFTPMFYSADVITRVDALATQRILAALLVFNLNHEYSKLGGFVWVRMSLAIVRPNSLFIRGPWYKEE